MPRHLLAWFVCSLGCGSACGPSPVPAVQDSSVAASAAATVALNSTSSSAFAPIAPTCLVVGTGLTLEFRNYLPIIPASITSLQAPTPLYSPNLQEPYNYVGSYDPTSDGTCIDAACTARYAFSFWRYTFTQVGIYNYVVSGSASLAEMPLTLPNGTQVIVPAASANPVGTVCVQAADGSGCSAVCCQSDADCGSGTCELPASQKTGRCILEVG